MCNAKNWTVVNNTSRKMLHGQAVFNKPDCGERKDEMMMKDPEDAQDRPLIPLKALILVN